MPDVSDCIAMAWRGGWSNSKRAWWYYLILLAEHTYELTDIISFQLYARNYNKVANDPDMDFHNTELGIGLKASY